MPSYNPLLERFEALDAQVLGVSVDSMPCHQAWDKALGGLRYPLLSDFQRRVARSYGVLNEEANVARRSAFLIDKGGVLRYRHVEAERGVFRSGEELLAELEKLPGAP